MIYWICFHCGVTFTGYFTTHRPVCLTCEKLHSKKLGAKPL